MGNSMTDTNFTLWSLMVLVANAISPEAAAGAVCGGIFFWSLSPEIPLYTRFCLAVASIGIGYGIGLPAARSDSWSGFAWAFAGLGASLAHVMIVSLRSTVKGGSPLPPWLLAIIDLLPWKRTRAVEAQRDSNDQTETRGDV